MTDNTTLNAGAGGDTFRDIDRGGVKTQVVQIDFGGGNLNTEQLVSATNPFPITAPTPLAVTGTFWQATQPVSGTVSVSGSVAVTGTFFQATQPVSIASPVAVTGTFWQATQPVSGTVTANAGSGTFAISAASLPLPTGAATAANQTSLTALFPSTIGQKASAGSLSVVLASDQGAVPTTPTAPSNCNRLLSAAATTNATSVKASSGTIKGIQGFNAKAAQVFLKLYNKATAPTVGTDTPVKTICIPASGAFALDFSFGFSTGIAFALTGAAADADTTALAAGDILALNIDYI